MIVILQQAERSEPGVGFASVLCGGSARNRRRNPMLGEATGLREVDPRKLVEGGDRQEGRID
jgi:hypothetical protein